MRKETLERFEQAKKVFSKFGVDVDAAIKEFNEIPISLQCWAGDDIKGFEGVEGIVNENTVVGNYPYAARTPDELRKDMEKAFSLSPLKHKVQLHSIYAEFQTERSKLTGKDWINWINWAKKLGIGLDLNGSFFSSKMMDDGLSLTSPNKEIRDYWIEVGKSTRRCCVEIGKALGIPCYNNFWIPDGLKDITIDRKVFRQRLIEGLDAIYGEPYSEEDSKWAIDVLEGKYFGIGTEHFVVGSHEFYVGYAAKHGLGVTIDTGHFREAEDVADKITAIEPFVSNIMLHVSRPIHWDSDHTVIENDCLHGVLRELKRAGLLKKVGIGLDFFDASVNRVFEWTIGLRATAKALLMALLEPTELMRKAELDRDYSTRLFYVEENNNLPYNDVWEYILESKGIPGGQEALEALKQYEREVQSLRK